MTMDQIETFLWVARLGGVGKAALQMNITQPAVSNRIGALEESLGVRLFDRKNKGVSLTLDGVILRNRGEQIALSIEQIKAEVTPVGGVKDVLRVGVTTTIAESWLPVFLSKMVVVYPNITFDTSVNVSHNLSKQLLGRELDLAFLMGPIPDFSVNNVDLPKFEMAWFKSYGSAVPDLSKVPIICYSRNSRPFRELRDELFLRYGGSVRMFPTNSLSTCFEMVAAGIGVGVFPKALGNRMLKDSLIELFDPYWLPESLFFTASYIGDPGGGLAEKAAKIAFQIASNEGSWTRP
ncbi:MAG: LysR family transcriptional regulator [Gammaproteobacteria bacterium]|nr:LysR family transcriptional regulator [Gammaproteobacteria bacterium]